MHPRSLAWITAATATACALGMVSAAGLRIEGLHILIFSGLVGLVVGIQAFYGLYRRETVVADLFGTLAVNAWALGMIGILALAGLAMNAALIDDALIRADAVLGLDARSAVEAISHWPLLHAPLSFAYTTSVALILLAPLGLVILRRPEAAWQLCTGVALSGLACALLSIPFPAAGAFSGLHLPQTVIARLPAGSGLYHLPAFEAFRSGRVTSVDVFGLSGVVTFPSFHAAFACVTAHALMPLKRLRFFVICWTVLVFASTVVIGGHYFIDLLVGAAVSAVAILATRAGQATPGRPSQVYTAVSAT